MYGYKETGIHPSLGLVTTKEDECQHVTGTRVFSVCLPFLNLLRRVLKNFLGHLGAFSGLAFPFSLFLFLPFFLSLFLSLLFFPLSLLFFSLFLFLLDKLCELVVGEVGSGYAAVLYHDVVGNTGKTEAGEEGAFHHLAVADNITG